MVLLTARLVERAITGIHNLLFRRLRIYTHLGGGAHIFSLTTYTRFNDALYDPFRRELKFASEAATAGTIIPLKLKNTINSETA